MSLLTALKTGYETLNLDGNYPVYAGFGPTERPATYTQIVPYGGLPLDYPVGLREPAVQINVVTDDRQAGVAHALAEAAFNALHNKTGWSLTGWKVELCRCSEPVQRTSNTLPGKTIFTINCRLAARVVPVEDD